MTSGSGNSGGGGDGDMRRTRSASVSFKDIPTTTATTTLSMFGNTILQPQHHQQQQQRDRGFSFECFSLGILDDDDERTGEGFTEVTGIDVDAIHQQSMQCSSSSNSNNSNIQRPRGDSIIFDPTSFLMGGIHETSALSSSSQKHTYNNNNNGGDMNSRYPMMTCSTGDGDIALAAAPAAATSTTTTLPMFSSNYMLQPPLMHAPLAIPIIASPSRKERSSKQGRDSMQQLQQQQRKRGSPRRVKTRGGLDDSSGQREKNVIAALAFAVGGSNDNNNNNSNDPIIHVPRGNTNFSMSGTRMYHHGSTRILSSQSHTDSNYINSNRDIDRSSLSSQSTTTTTTCPMELINKGGRVGIYLPDERRARIAKFHTKRKVRIWRKRIKYDCRKKLADSRPRIKGRFVKRSDVEECGVEGEGNG